MAQNSYYCSDEEADETISFSDYSLVSSNVAAEEGEDHHHQSALQVLQNSSGRSDQDNCFEFCSEEWSHSVVSSDDCYPPENIVFCGKLIVASAGPTSQVDNLRSLMSNEEERANRSKPGAAGAGAEYYSSFRWDGSHNTYYNRKKPAEMLRSSTTAKMSRCRWSLFLLGGGTNARTRSQTDRMALRDIKSRQGRLMNRSTSTLFRLDRNGGGDKKMTIGNNGLWGMLKAVSHGGQRHGDSVVNASVGCIPRL